MTIAQQAYHLLKVQSVPLATAQIAEVLNAKPGSVHDALDRNRATFQATRHAPRHPTYWQLLPNAPFPRRRSSYNGKGTARWRAMTYEERYAAVLDEIRRIAAGRDVIKIVHFNRLRQKWMPGMSALGSSTFGAITWYEWLAMAGVAHKCSAYCGRKVCGGDACGGQIVTGRVAMTHEYMVILPLCAKCARLFDEDEERWQRGEY